MQSRSGGSDWDRCYSFIAESDRGVQSRHPQHGHRGPGWLLSGCIAGLLIGASSVKAEESSTQAVREAEPAPRETPHTVVLETGSVSLDSYFRTYSRSLVGLHYLHDVSCFPSMNQEPGLLTRMGGGFRYYWPMTYASVPLEVFGEVQVLAPVRFYQPGLSLEVGITGVATFFIHNRSMEDGSAQVEAGRTLPLYAELGAAPLRFRPGRGALNHVTVSLLELHLGTLLLPPSRVSRIQITLASVGGHF